MAATEQERGPARVVYAAPEPGGPMRSARGGLALLAAVAVIFSLGVIAGRVSVPRQPAARQQPAAGTPPQQTTATTQPAPADQPAQAAPEGHPGPTRTRAGVPVGYARTREGAVAAATAYIKVLSSPLILDERRRRDAVEVLADPRTRQQQLDALETGAPAIAQSLRLPPGGGTGGTPVLLQTIPVRVRVEAFTADTATVAVWQTSLGGTTNGVPVLQRWGTTTVKLRWVDGDWKQVEARSSPGPVPLADDAQPTAASELIGKVGDYEEYQYAPGP